ncbi:MAG: Gfo/Idh/MocA family oxidoreductase [Chloroflexi bacterium]|nr:Gfo/Idh/MocA family oxidoreductase [Chloroflexota bacterium]
MSDQVRLGFIGMGGIARHHLRQLADIPEAVIVGIAEPSETALTQMRKEFPYLADVPAFADYHELLDKVPMDAVEIHTPHTQHFQQALDVFAAGKHLLLEKPMVCSTIDAHKLIEAGKNQVFMVSYQRHFEGTYIYIRDQVRAGALGKIQYVQLLLSQNWYRATMGSWRQCKALSGGGQFNDSGSHIVDIMLWTTGLTAESVFAFMKNYDSEVDIDSAASIRFTNGAQGTISIIGDSPLWWEEFSIWGNEGMMLIRQGKLMQARFGDKEPQPVAELPTNSNPDRNFIDAVLGRDTIKVPPECGLRVIELTEAAWKSAELGRPVKVTELA